MTKHELVEQLAGELGVTHRKVEQFLTALTSTIASNMARGEKTAITGFGTFDLGKRAARRGVNPQTHEPIEIPEMPMPRFRAGKHLTAIVRGK